MKIVKLLEKFDDAFSYVGIAFFILFTAVTFSQVISRYFFMYTLPWAEEISRFSFIWMAYIGMSSCMRHDIHLKVDVLSVKLQGASKTILYVIDMLISLIFCLFIVYWGYDMLNLVYESEQVALTVPVPLVLVWISIPLSFAFACIHIVANIVRALQPKEYKEQESLA